MMQSLLLSYSPLSSSGGGGGSTFPQPIAYDFYTSFTDDKRVGEVVADDSGNVYGITDDAIFKVSSNGTFGWAKSIPTTYFSNNIDNAGLKNISVSPNGTYLVVGGNGGPEGYSGYGSQIVVCHINTSNGDVIDYYFAEDTSNPLNVRMPNLMDMIVTNDGICNVCGNLYRIFDAPYQEFCRILINLPNGTVSAFGETDGTYQETWDRINTNGTHVIMGGLDSHNVQPGYQTYNWTKLDHSSNTVVWSKTWQSNQGNGVRGDGVCITDPIGGSVYQWSDGVEASGWAASDLSDYMFNGSLNTFAKAETAGTDYLGWDNTGTTLPPLTGPVEIYLAYANVANYTYTVNGASVSPNTTGAADSGAWITISTGDVTNFRVTSPSSSSNIQIAGVRSNGVLVTEDVLYGGTPKIFVGYGEDATSQRGIAELNDATGEVASAIKIHYSSQEENDLNFQILETDGTNVYFVAANYTGTINTGKNTWVIGAYDIAGSTIQWARILKRTTSPSVYIKKMRYNATRNALDISGYGVGDGTDKTFIISLPADGSGIGAYGSYSYEAITLNSSVSTISWYHGTPTFDNHDSSKEDGEVTTGTNKFDFYTLDNENGQDEIVVPGTYTWRCPAGVTSVSAVCVGGGGAGKLDGQAGGGGGGGGLGYVQSLSVSAGSDYTIQVGAAGSPASGNDGDDSYFQNINTVSGFGGKGSNTAGHGGGSWRGDGGGTGGSGGAIAGGTSYEGGGGGAGGYSGDGGNGGGGDGSSPPTSTEAGTAGQGGAGGGGSYGGGYDGGGVRLKGEGTSGAGGVFGGNPFGSGETGSYTSSEVIISPHAMNNTQSIAFGGGSAGAQSYNDPQGHGAVRVIWGAGRQYPDQATDDVYPNYYGYSIGDWVEEQGGYYAGLLSTSTESFTNLDPAGTLYRIFIAEKSVSQSMGQYKTTASCDGSHSYPGTTTAPNAAYDGYFNTYTSVVGTSTVHPVFQTVQALSITVNGNVFDDWYIPAHQEAGIVYRNLENATGWQSSSQAFDTSSAGSSNDKGELWTSSGDSCSNSGVLTTAGKWFPNNGIVYGYYKDDVASIRPVRRVPINDASLNTATLQKRSARLR